MMSNFYNKRASIILILFAFFNVNLILASLIPQEKDGLWGYVNEKGKWKIKPEYHYVGNFNDGLAPVMKYYNHNGAILPLWGYVNNDGKEVLSLKYDFASDFNNGIAFVGYLPGTHWEAGTTTNLLQMRFIDLHGNESNFANNCFNYAIFDTDSVTLLKNVFTKSSYGYRDSTKERLIRSIKKCKVSYPDLRNTFSKTNTEAEPSFVMSDSNFKTKLEVGAPFVLSDSNFDELIDSINSIPKSLFRKRDNNIIYLPNKSTLDVITENLKPNLGVITPKSAHGMWGFVNECDQWVIPAMYDYIEQRKSNGNNSQRKDYISNLHYVHGCDGWGAIDTIGNIFIKPIYDSIQPLHGYAKKAYYFLITKDGNHGLINEEGKIALPINKFRQHINFFPEINRMLYADENGNGIIADSTGGIVCTIDRTIHWRGLSPQTINNKAIVTGDWEKRGVVDWRGNEIVPHIYDFIYMDDDFIEVRTTDGCEGAYSYSGKNIIPVKFKSFSISSIGLLIGVKQDDTYDMDVFDLNGNPVIHNGKHLIVHRTGRQNWSDNFFALATENGYILFFEKGLKLSKYLYKEVEWQSESKEVVVKRFNENGSLVVEKYDENGNIKYPK